MSKKRLIEVEVLNKVCKAIETHLKLLQQYPMTMENEHQVKVMATSINYLEKSLIMLNPIGDQIKEMKREAFTKYQTEKQKLKEMKESRESINEINNQEIKVESYLKLYLAYKGS